VYDGIGSCDVNITHFEIRDGETISVEDTLTTESMETMPSQSVPVPIDTDSTRILILLSTLSEGSKISYYDTTGKILGHWKRSEPLRNPQIVDDSLLLCTTIAYNPIGMLCNSKGELIRKILFPLETRWGINYETFGDYLFTVGFQDISDTTGIQFNWTIGCYNRNNLEFISDAGGYPIRMYSFYFERLRVSPGPRMEFAARNDTIEGAFALYPVIFRHCIKTGEETRWRVPIDDFTIPDLVENVRPDRKDLLLKQLARCGWSFQYYANFVDDSLFIVFREHNPPYYIDLYNFKPDTHVYMGSVQVKDGWQPVSSYKNRIVMLDRTLLLKQNRIKLQLAYLEL